MIFQRAVRREFTQAAVGVFVALFAILLTTQLIRLLGQAASGQVASEAVVALLGFAALNSLPVLLSLTVFMAILLTLSRSYRDSEMVVWFASGQSLVAWVRPVLTFALPVVVTIALLSLLISPWALKMSAEYRQKLSGQSRNDTAQVAPGAFKESGSGDRVVFVEAVADDSSLVRNVFVSSLQHQKLGVMMASSGHSEQMENGDRFMILENGRRYEVTPGQPEFRILEFARYALRVETKESQGIEKTPRNTSTRELLKNRSAAALAEVLWRVGVPISALVLALLAIPMSFVNPRAGRSANLILALLTFTIYSNLLSVSQAWVTQGRLSFDLGWWLVHVVMAALLPLLFFRRIAVFSFLRWRNR
jgi:lipopolysaccharide export system permease protein